MNKGGIVEEFQSIIGNEEIPPYVKRSCENCIKILSEDGELPVQINSCTSILDRVAQSSNINPWIRTKLWTVVSKLESLD